MDHYFTDNRHLKENRKEITFRFWCFNCSFITDNGVFSKDAIDYGTRVLLNTIHDRDELKERVLDVGCGYGVIGIALKKAFPDKKFTMIDVNPRAVALAKENCKRNQVDINVLASDVYEHINGNTFTDIITNPPIRAGKEIIYQIFEGAYDHLELNGALWIVIRKSHGALSAQKKVKEVFGNCEIINREKGYFILKSIKKH